MIALLNNGGHARLVTVLPVDPGDIVIHVALTKTKYRDRHYTQDFKLSVRRPDAIAATCRDALGGHVILGIQMLHAGTALAEITPDLRVRVPGSGPCEKKDRRTFECPGARERIPIEAVGPDFALSAQIDCPDLR